MKKLSIVCVVGLAGCMSGGMNGVMSDGTPVLMKYEQGMSSDTYKTVINGETFVGKAVSADATTMMTNGFSSVTAYSGANTAAAYGNSFGMGTAMGGKFVAVLIGDKGNALNCMMQYADTTGFTSAGGVGQCHHSDGRSLALTW